MEDVQEITTAPLSAHVQVNFMYSKYCPPECTCTGKFHVQYILPSWCTYKGE